MQILARTALVALFGLAAQVAAEPRVCIGGDLDRLSQGGEKQLQGRGGSGSAGCDAVPRAGRLALCGGVYGIRLDDLCGYFGAGAKLAALNVDTDVKRKMTFFRGATLAMGDTQFNRRLIAREAARGLMPGADEAAIEKQVAALVTEAGMMRLRWLLRGSISYNELNATPLAGLLRPVGGVDLYVAPRGMFTAFGLVSLRPRPTLTTIRLS